ncbi:LysM peptidoglycan-binding domain-containing protein [Arthrobacter sulfonylureivorans]|uniref:LysM peptidoglycan-binding domain-containing protein n=1 Tax=Arthrobacter sulfonylureivorans TaxID=2486855 RepID=UPI0039E2A50F
MAVKVLTKRASGSRVMKIVTEAGKSISLHSTPGTFSVNAPARLGEVEREGKKPLTRVVGPGLRRYSFTHIVASLDWTVDVEAAIKSFFGLSTKGTKIRFSGGSAALEAGVWFYIENLEINVVRRAKNLRPSHAELSWTLVEASDVKISTSKPKAKKKAATGSRATTTTRQHKVRSGETLWLIAQRYLGAGSRWPEIYALNKSLMKNPNTLKAGWTLKIPRK